MSFLRKPAGRLGVVSPCERSENKEGVWGRGVVDKGAFFGRNRRCLGCVFECLTAVCTTRQFWYGALGSEARIHPGLPAWGSVKGA